MERVIIAATPGPKRNKPVKLPKNIYEFRGLPGAQDNYIIPEVPEKRKATDVKFVIGLVTALGILAIFLIYGGSQSRISRIIRGTDYCGNVCGEENKIQKDVSCSGTNMTDKPFTLWMYLQKMEIVVPVCVKSCDSPLVLFFNRCISPKSQIIMDNMVYIFVEGGGYLLLLCLIGLGASIGMLLLFKYCTRYTVWFTLISGLCGLTIYTIMMWFDVINKNLPMTGPFWITVCTLCYCITIACVWKKIKLVIEIFQETAEIIFAIPLILLQPILTILSFLILFICLLMVYLILENAGDFMKFGIISPECVKDVPIIFIIWFNSVMALWMSFFIIGCQYMLISGAISASYFIRDKSAITNPIYNSYYNLVRYHLGTAAFGSLVITVTKVLTELIKGCIKNKGLLIIFSCLLNLVEDVIEYMTYRAYIQTAMHGQPFLKSGKRAVRLLLSNSMMTLATSAVGDFVLVVTEIYICMIPILIGILMDDGSVTNFWIIITIAAIITFIFADCFLCVFKIGINTVFLCYCEDIAINDGTEDRPYFMSTRFAKCMEKSKLIYKPKKEIETAVVV